ncbi:MULTISPECIES: hypothetical protein [Ramlibacter]|uniref:Uncharacterized protein n=1 Tax=Ramlibacter pinisoli TaxID=2682844 RepID=A0A6N8ITC4_9BURK|nr:MULTISPECIES: hypothetical protein [Ramlibacter]MBA2964880.1 hypothetical protein [Ramlibacter sp. CGMCC 1.13660]MVQ29845.1 hypothetical protein [Ramlibacter pinisoli]
MGTRTIARTADWQTHERLLVGLRGWHMALCALETGDGSGEYTGYYKICAGEPASYWEADCLLKGCSQVPRRSPRDALRDAEDMARSAVYHLPAPRALAAVRAARPLNVYERHDLYERTRRV